MSQQKHIGHLEALRALAAIMVMGFHFISFHNSIDFIIYNEGVRTYSQFGAQGVELFYIISGFVISYSFVKNDYKIKNYFRYVVKRIIRIIPTYIMAILIALGVKAIIMWNAWEVESTFNWKEFLVNATFMADVFPDVPWINEIYKTLKVEFQFYIIIGLIWPLLSTKKWVKLLLFFIWMIAGILTHEHQTILINAPYFIIGISLCQLYLAKDVTINWLLIGVVLVVLGVFYEWQDLVISILGIVAIQFIRFSWKPINFLGKSSYTLYLLHGTIGGWFLFWYTRDDFVHLNHLLAIAIAGVISILGSILLYYLLEKPFVRLGKRIKYKNRIR